MAVNIVFKEGSFQRFRALADIHLGELNINLPAGSEVGFDGTTMKWGSKDYSYPKLASGIKAEWLIPVADTTTQYVPKPAGVQVRPATSAGQERGEVMPLLTAVDEEQVVGNLEQSNKKRSDAGVKASQASRAAVKAPQESKVAPAPKQASSKFKVEVEAQEARPIATIKTQAKQKTVLTDASAAAQEIQRLDNQPPPKPKKLTTVAQGEDIKAKGAGGATGDVDTIRSGDELSDLLPDAATSGVPRPGHVEQDAAGVARLVWDKNIHWKQRVQTAVEKFGNDPNALRQILEVEAESVVKHIRAALARKTGSNPTE